MLNIIFSTLLVPLFAGLRTILTYCLLQRALQATLTMRRRILISTCSMASKVCLYVQNNHIFLVFQSFFASNLVVSVGLPAAVRAHRAVLAAQRQVVSHVEREQQHCLLGVASGCVCMR